ncbi:MAG: putative amidophosphoribosyltransferase, partial [Parasphingorhabdus sp.]
MINKCLLFMQSLVFPEVCVFCRSTEHCAAGICQSCYSQLPWAVQGCPICALSIGTDLICGACINNQPSFDASIAVFNYKEPITNGIHALKFHHQFCFSRTFSITLARLISGLDLEPRPDAILAVPAHSKRLRIRGFNQATEIATTLSRILSIPMLDNTLFRTNENSPQRTLTKTQR